METSDLLRKSILVTVTFGTAATVFYAVAGGTIVRVAFGGRYADAAGLLWLFGIAMTGYAVLNIILIYDLGRGGRSVAWLFAGGAVVQVGAFLLVHGSARELIAVDIGVAGALLVAEEIATDRMLFRALTSRAPARRPEPL
jgi:O-antigen/teichoic acid export membrane protein